MMMYIVAAMAAAEKQVLVLTKKLDVVKGIPVFRNYLLTVKKLMI